MKKLVLILIILLVGCSNTEKTPSNDKPTVIKEENKHEKEKKKKDDKNSVKLPEVIPETPEDTPTASPQETPQITMPDNPTNPLQNSLIPIEIRIKDGSVSSSGLTLILKNNTNVSSSYGIGYTLESKVDGNWKTVEPISDLGWTFITIAHVLDANTEHELDITWVDRLGVLEPGEYRINKDDFNLEFNI